MFRKNFSSCACIAGREARRTSPARAILRDCGEGCRIVWGGAARSAGPVAQWLEPTAHNGLVGGSSPPGPTTQSIVCGDFPTHGENPRIGGVGCEHFVSAKRYLDFRGHFEAVVSGLGNPVSRQQRLAQAETGLNPSLTAE